MRRMMYRITKRGRITQVLMIKEQNQWNKINMPWIAEWKKQLYWLMLQTIHQFAHIQSPSKVDFYRSLIQELVLIIHSIRLLTDSHRKTEEDIQEDSNSPTIITNPLSHHHSHRSHITHHWFLLLIHHGDSPIQCIDQTICSNSDGIDPNECLAMLKRSIQIYRSTFLEAEGFERNEMEIGVTEGLKYWLIAASRLPWISKKKVFEFAVRTTRWYVEFVQMW